MPSPKSKRRTFPTTSINQKSDADQIKTPSINTTSFQSNRFICDFCNARLHAIFQCTKFLDQTVRERIEAECKANLCLYCLRSNHKMENWKSGNCRVCHKSHSTKPHLVSDNDSWLEPSSKKSEKHEARKLNQQDSAQTLNISTKELLVTAIINAFDRDQKVIECRTLVDTCSNADYITEQLASKLHLPIKTVSAAIEALNALNTFTNKIVSTTIQSRLSNFQRYLTFFVIPRISGPLLDAPFHRSGLRIPANIKLADPNFDRPASIDGC